MKKIFKSLVVLFIVIAVTCAGLCMYLSTKFDIRSTGMKNTQSSAYIGIKKLDVEMKDYVSVMEEAFTKLTEVVNENPNVVFGKAFSMYEKSSVGDNYDLLMGYEIKKGQFTISNPEFVFGNRPSIYAKSFELKGKHEYLMYAWTYAMIRSFFTLGYIIDNNNFSYEVYKVSYDETENQDEFITEIFIPIKPRQ